MMNPSRKSFTSWDARFIARPVFELLDKIEP